MAHQTLTFATVTALALLSGVLLYQGGARPCTDVPGSVAVLFGACEATSMP
jgi:hypothetical protein